MALHGSTSLTSTTLLEIVGASNSWLSTSGANNKAQGLVRENYVLHNDGPDAVYVMVHDGGGSYGSTEGLKLPSGSTLNVIHAGSLFVHCPTATAINPISISWIVTTS